MKATAPIGPIKIPEYNFIRHSLPGRRGRNSKAFGGVGVYVNKSIKAVPFLKSSYDPNTPNHQRFEFLALRAKINDLNTCIVTVYNPNANNQLFPQQYENLMLDLLEHNFDRTYILGDFNINVMAPNPSVNLRTLHQLNSTFKFDILRTNATRITETSSTTIDLMMTDAPDSVLFSKTASSNGISDHEIVHLLTDVRIRKPPPKRIKVRNFKRVNQLNLQADFQAIDFRQFISAHDVETKVQILTSHLQHLIEAHAPEKVKIVKDYRTPWMTPRIERAVNIRNLAFSLYHRNPNRRRGDEQWQEYSRERNRVNSLILAAKKQYADRNFSHDLPAKQLWNNLKREGIHNPSKQQSDPEDIDLNGLNSFFAEGHTRLSHASSLHNCDHQYPTHLQPVRTFQFVSTDVEIIVRHIFEIQSNAVGIDQIPISFIKMLCPYILPFLEHLFNHIIECKTFPSMWKTAIITPLPKVSNPVEHKDFRPISVLPAMSKILEKVLLAQITNHLDTSNPSPIARCQSGYRRGYSTTTALTKVVHDIYSGFGDDDCTLMVLVDLSLAFNCVKHSILDTKLDEEFGFTRNTRDLISSYLSQRNQIVRYGELNSNSCELRDGTPQGSCLSAMLFSLYINSLPNVLECSYQLYADDLQLYVTGPQSEIDHLILKMNRDLEAIDCWTRKNQLFPNPKKTQSIIFTRRNSVTPAVPVIFCGEVIAVSKTVVNLGLRMDNNLRWRDQVNDIMMKVYGTLRTFNRFKSVLSLPTRKKLAQSIIMPFFMYCDIVYYPGLSQALKEKLHRAFKSVIRFVHNLRHRESTGALRRTITGCDLPANYSLRIGCFMFKAYNNNVPDYLLQHIQRGQMDRTRTLVVPQHTHSSGKSVLVYGASQWNSLALPIRQKNTISSFKSAFSLE